MAWQIYELTDSALQVGLLGLARAIPQMALAVAGGYLADAIDRRRLMLLSQLLQMSVTGALVLTTVAGATTPAILFAAAVLLALGTAFETPVRQAIVPNLVPREQLGSAIAITTMQRSVGSIAGPSLAGVIVAIAGPGWCYFVNSFAWVPMIAALILIRAPLQERAGAGRISLAELGAGVRFVVSQQVILAFMVLDFGATLFGSSIALLPVYARDLLEIGPVGLGMMYAAPSVGALVTSVIMSVRPQAVEAGKWVLLGVVFYAICTMGFAVSSSVPLSILLLAGTGVGNMVSAVLRGTTNQLLTPDALRGRVAAVNSVFVMGGPQLGQFESGLVSALIGVRASAFTGGLGALLLVGGIALLPAVRGFRLDETRSSPASVPITGATRA
jgi:MFS family permease